MKTTILVTVLGLITGSALAFAGADDTIVKGENALIRLDSVMKNPTAILKRFRPAKPSGIGALAKVSLTSALNNVGKYNIRFMAMSENVVVTLTLTRETQCKPEETGYRASIDLTGSGDRTLGYLEAAYVDLCAFKIATPVGAQIRSIFRMGQIKQGKKFDPQKHYSFAKEQVENVIEAVVDEANAIK